MFLILVTLITHIDLKFFDHALTFSQLWAYLSVLIKRKAFYALSVIGLISLFMMIFKTKSRKFATLNIDSVRLKELSILALCILAISLISEKDMTQKFGMLWFIVFLCILPLEWIFQSISRLRSRRNFIYAMYVLVCLLDSHFEGRVRIVVNFYKSPPDVIELLTR